MKRSSLVASLTLWLTVGIACLAFLIWYQTGDSAANFEVVSSSRLLQYLYVEAGAFVAYAGGAVVGTLIAHFARPRLGAGARMTFRVVSILLLAVMALCPLFLATLPRSVQLPLAIVLYVGLKAPFVFLVAGVLLGLSLAQEAPVDPAPAPLGPGAEEHR